MNIKLDHIDYKISKVKFNKFGKGAGVVQVKNKGKVDGPIEVNVINKDKSINFFKSVLKANFVHNYKIYYKH